MRLRGFGRAPSLVAFAVLLFASSAVPVLAEEPIPPDASEAEAALLPTAVDVQKGIEAAEVEKAERAEELQAPQAIDERQRSRYAFADLSAPEAQDLLQSVFAEQLSMLNTDPARFLSDAEIITPLSGTAATVNDDGDTSLLDAGMPVRIRDGDGDLKKVDLSLEATADGFETANALSAVRIGESAAEPVEVGEEGLSISEVGAEEGSDARRLGDQDVFHFEALTDTDTLVSPTASGVEIFNVLRSEDSPETMRFELALPEGAMLRDDGKGGAEVVRDGETLAVVPFPTAVDAQGTDVPVELTVEGNSISLHVEHRGGDYAMPILVDPAILEDWVNANTSWINGYNLNALSNGSWQSTSSPSGLIYAGTSCFYTCWGSGRGLYLSAPSRNYGAGVDAHWSYSAPNLGSYISKAWLIPFWRDDHGCSQSSYSQPHDYDGFWGDNQWNKLQSNQAIEVGSVAVESWGRAFIVGLNSGNGVNIPCWRDLMVGGAAIWLDDWERPSLTTSSTGTWMDSSPVRLNVSATDGGLGVKSFEATATTSSGSNQTWMTNHPCTGLYGSRCPGSWNLAETSQPMLSFNPSVLPEGIRKLQVTAYDVTGKPSYNMNEMTVRVDHSAPTVSFSGTVTQQATLGTEKPSYTFRADAVDGVPGSQNPDDVRSGATGLVVKNDGQVVSEYKPGCPTQSCSLFREIEVPAATLPAGAHTLSVTATDAFGHTSQPKQLTYTTGDKKAPELSLTGWLTSNTTISGYPKPGGVTATDTGFGVTSVVVKLTDEAQSTEVLGEQAQSCSKGACSLSVNLDEVDLTGKAPGAYVLTVSVKDGAGNVRNASHVVNLDSAPPEIFLSGALADSAGQPLTEPSAELEIAAHEVDPASGGVKTINVERDWQLVASYPSDCSSDCHEVNASYSFHRAEDGANRAIRPVASSSGGSTGELKRVSCTAFNDCWAVGRTKYTAAEQGEGKTAAPLLERWTGSEWQATTVPKPAGATDAFLEGVSCSSTSSCVAVGYYFNGSANRPLIELWDGTKWASVAASLPSGASGASLNGISCSSTSWTSCWIFGRTQVTSGEQAEGKTPAPFFERWTGSAWQTTTTPKPAGATDAFLEGVSCRSTSACVAVGYYYNGSANRSLIELWDGTKWATVSPALPSGASGASLNGISCSSTSWTSCWIFGRTQVTSGEQAEGKTPAPFFERWTGSAWQTATTPKPPLATETTLTSVSCSSDTSCTAVGRFTNGHAETLPLAYTWDGTEWRYQPAPQPVETSTSSLTGVSCVAADQCSMVGYWRIGSGKWSVLAETEAPGQGPHTIRVEAVDAQDNAESKTIKVDVPEEVAETPECDPEAASVNAKGIVSAGQAIDTLEESLPAVVAPSEGVDQETTELEVNPSYTDPQPNLESENSLADSEAAVTPEGGFALADVACVVPEQTTPAATDAEVVNQDAALFANTAPETDTVIRPTATGATVVQSLRGPNAPSSFSWKVKVGSGQELVKLPPGTVALVQDPLDGKAIEGVTVGAAPKDAESEKALTDAALQLESSEYELARAQGETSQEVVAVIAHPWVVLSEGVTVPAKIEVAQDVQVPIVWEVEVILPQEVIEAETHPVGLAVAFLSSFAANGHCTKEEGSPCGAPDLDRAAGYAVYWGDEAHNHARNNKFQDYGSNDCTNFISQIIRAAGTKFMRYRVHGDGSWWYDSTFPLFGPPLYDNSESWTLADELPRHLWRFGLAHIDPVQQPWGWTKGDIIAMDWYGTGGKGDINHLMFVVGTRDGVQGREPQLANHSTDSYANKAWVLVKKRIELDEGSNWTRFALALKHTMANLDVKLHTPANLYGPGGLFDG